MIPQECSEPGCGQSALLFTEPPMCFQHVQDFDSWYEQTLALLTPRELPKDDMGQLAARSILDNLYRESLLSAPEGVALYRDYKNRVDPREDVQFCFADVVYFVLAAAASGVIANITYDAIKSCLARLPRGQHVIETYVDVVLEKRYEELRVSLHGRAAADYVSSRIERVIERKYRLLILEEGAESHGDEFDPDCIETLSLEQFRRFGIACCYRLGCDRKDKRLAKALKRLEQSLGPPVNEKMRRDAYNAGQLRLHRPVCEE